MAELLSALILLTVTIPFDAIVNGERMRVHDPWIGCSAAKAPTYREGLPSSCDQSIYYNNMQLCSANNGAHRSVGCVCYGEFWPLYCNPRIADSDLWWANVTRSRQRFPSYCKSECSCTTKDQAAQLLEQGKYMNPEWVANGNGQPHVSDDVDSESESDDSFVGLSSHAGGLSNSTSYASHNQCPGKCSTNADCGDQGNGCMCSTQSEQYLPSQGTVKFIAACIISMASNPKRENDRPCPCNATYVSHACCGAMDGLVRESKLNKLGELLTEDDLGQFYHD